MASLEIGIVGLPNVGKTSVFNALTNAGAEVTAYAATQSSANIGVAPVPDARLDDLAEVAESRETIYATIQLSDVSGLVRGGAKGGSLGGEFLGHLRATDAILHVVRTFGDADVFHVDGRVDPVADAEAVDLELILADHAIVERRVERLAKAARTGDKVAASEADVLGRLLAHLDGGQPARLFPEPVPAGVDLLTVKPLVYVANTSEEGDADAVAALRQYAGDADVVPVAARFEADLAEMEDPEERGAFLAEIGQDEAGMPRVARAAFRLLELITFFTVGPKEARAWPLRRGSTAVEAAGKIHSDIARGFIRAEVITTADMLQTKTHAEALKRGVMRVEGRDYVIADGDVINVRFNV
jgi:ribosome-binding ATPase